MDKHTLLRVLASNKDAKALRKAIKDGSARGLDTVRVGGLLGSSAPLYFAAIAEKGDLPALLFVLNDQDEAGYFYHDLVQMLGEDRVLFFPSSYKRAIRFNQKDAANAILRTEVLTKLASGMLVVTYPEALAEKVISESELSDNTIVLRNGAVVDLQLLRKSMMDLGMHKVDYVYEPGQFAIRGSIVDVYSYASETPFRVDFFGDEIDSIRTFDVQTQLSEKKVEQMTIVPDIAGNESRNISFLEFLPKDAVVVARDHVYLCDKISQTYDAGFAMQAIVDSKTDGVNEDLLKDRVIVRGEDFARQLSGLRKMELKNDFSSEGSNIQFSIQVQPLYHKNFELVQSDFIRLKSEGYKICIFSDSEKQIQRLHDIFDEKSQTEFDKIPFDSVLSAIHEGFVDEDLKQCFFTDHQIFDRFHKYNLKSDKARRGKVALTMKELMQFEIGDYVVHIDHGVGRFGGLVTVPENGVMVEKIRINYQDGGTIYVSIHALHKISKYKGKDGEPPRVNKLGSGAWEKVKEKVKTKVKDIARDLIRLYAQRKHEKGFAFSPDSYMQRELEASFAYEDTPDQLRTTQEVKADMEKSRPMDRLVCGDVGFGKTEVAIRAAFKAATDGKQVAVLVPTTVLAYQHFQTFKKRLKDFPVTVEYLSRARTTKQQKEILEGLANGKVDIVIGTHKLVGKSVKFKDLGLLIIDEEQKFGVAVKEKLRQLKVNVDTLTMTATPIPRTLQFSLMGARDMSNIQTPPPNRRPIQTEIHTFSPEVFAEAINYEMSRNGQVFIVNNRINNLQTIADMVKEQVPDARVCIGHGQMNPEELEKILFDFMNYDYDVMISTTIVENGIDVPNANTIIINGANNYGLSDLHQMRGRVGRGNAKAFCYLIAPPLAALPTDSRLRLQAIEDFSDLGSGFFIASKDLDIRGAGNMLGAEQSGFIADLGFETYQKILNEALAELKETEFADIYAEESKDENGRIAGDTFVTETNIECDIPAFLPDDYVPVSGERMALYRELDSFTELRQVEEFRLHLIDRFGEIPEVGEELLKVIQIKWAAQKLGIETVSMKKGSMRLYLPQDENSLFYESAAFMKLITYASDNGRICELNESPKRHLKIKNIVSIASALEIFKEIEKK